ncbi:uncharacterized protein LOC131487834 isoform X2 [Neofelis nebulosa]|uniref:uncharacterized protein LOC131487834 isoform X2 n=1 Tax=Neofelis nebulosa TaxID=61452 RepID=UPI0027297CA8|nr:uncharacterized protein LOC131487834 isoform X2 [Neofelis nebulosa]
MPEEHHPPPLGEADAVHRAGGGNAPVGSPPFTRQRAQREQPASAADSTILPLRATGPPDAKGNQPYHYWPFTTSDLYNWKAQNPKFSEKPAGLIDLLDSVLFIYQPTWDDCQQLLQVLFTTEETERILNEARKLVSGTDGNPTTDQAQIDASFSLTRPKWDFNTAEVFTDTFSGCVEAYPTKHEMGPAFILQRAPEGARGHLAAPPCHLRGRPNPDTSPVQVGRLGLRQEAPARDPRAALEGTLHRGADNPHRSQSRRYRDLGPSHPRSASRAPPPPPTIRKDFVTQWAVNRDQHNLLKLKL